MGWPLRSRCSVGFRGAVFLTPDLGVQDCSLYQLCGPSCGNCVLSAVDLFVHGTDLRLKPDHRC